jgi:hypothetical protein
MRYLLRMIFNLAIDYDDDGNAAGGRLERRPEGRRATASSQRIVSS